MYQNDTFAGKVYGIPCGKDGTPDAAADWRTIVQLDAETEGAPDGMAIDAAGNLWVAHEQGGQVTPGHLPAVAVQPEPGAYHCSMLQTANRARSAQAVQSMAASRARQRQRDPSSRGQTACCSDLMGPARATGRVLLG